MNYFNYFTEIEETFIRRRGKHLLLSPMDWALIEAWKLKGVPLHVALRGIERAFDSYEAKPRRRSVKSLMYCQEEVEAQFAEWLESQLGGDDKTAQASVVTPDGNSNGTNGDTALPFPRQMILEHLAGCRAALERADGGQRRAMRDDMTEAFSRAVTRLSELERDFASAVRPDAERLETSLTDLEALLEREIRGSLSPAELASRRARAEEQLLPYQERMDRATYEQMLNNLLAKLLREEWGVPRLSLFYL